MLHQLIWVWIVILFCAGSVTFYYLPRSVGATAIIGLLVGTDIGGYLGIFSVVTGQGEMLALIVLITAIVMYWLIPAAISDCSRLIRRGNGE